MVMEGSCKVFYIYVVEVLLAQVVDLVGVFVW